VTPRIKFMITTNNYYSLIKGHNYAYAPISYLL